ncbi:MAG: hypothetical protein Q9182_003102 [Xanthomendoza sp. 2 TL-2023]
MKVRNSKAKKYDLMGSYDSNDYTFGPALDGYLCLGNDGPSAPLPRMTQCQQLRAQGEDRHHWTVLQLYTNDEGSLRLETGPAFRNGEQELFDIIARLVQTYNQNILGKTYLNSFHDRTETFLDTQLNDTHVSRGPSDGSVQEPGVTAVLSVRRKRRRSRASTSSWKRYKASSTDLPALPADDAEDCALETRVNTPDADRKHHPRNDSFDDDDCDYVLDSNQFETLTADDFRGIEVYYIRGFHQIGQVCLKKVLRVWIKIKIPRKQTTNPYNGRKKKEELEQQREQTGEIDKNPGRHTAPDWWPNQDDYERGRGCRHIGPDHVRTEERAVLLLKMIRMTSSNIDRVKGKKQPPSPFIVARLRAGTDQLEMMPEQRKLLEQIYQVREKEQMFEEGCIDGTTRIPVFKSQPKPTRKRKGGQRKPKLVNRMKQQDRGTSKTTKRSTRRPAARKARTACSLSSSTGPVTTPPLAMAKSDPQPPIDDAPLIVRAQTASTNDGLHFDPAMPTPNVTFGTTFTPDNPLQPNPNGFAQEVVPFEREQDPMACPTPARGRAPLRSNGMYYRRPTSVCNQNSPSYQEGYLPRTTAYNFNDDVYFGLCPPRTSDGYPNEHIAFPIGSINNHSHGGLLPQEQEQVCRSYGCGFFRTLQQHQEGSLINGWHSVPFSGGDHHHEIPHSNGLDAFALEQFMQPSPPDSELRHPFHQ